MVGLGYRDEIGTGKSRHREPIQLVAPVHGFVN
jgi:hypothetical protein